jgi:hypothetical protein
VKICRKKNFFRGKGRAYLNPNRKNSMAIKSVKSVEIKSAMPIMVNELYVMKCIRTFVIRNYFSLTTEMKVY